MPDGKVELKVNKIRKGTQNLTPANQRACTDTISKKFKADEGVRT